MPKWATPIRQLYLAKLVADYCAKSGWQLDLITGEVYHPLLETKTQDLIDYWKADDRARREADWKAERRAMHNLGERRLPLRGQFSTISKDVFFAEQPVYYVEGVGIGALTLKPFAKVRIASSYMHLHINLGDSLKEVSKNAKRKALRHGKLSALAQGRIRQAVWDYLNR